MTFSHNLWFTSHLTLQSNQQPYKVSEGIYRVDSEYLRMHEARDPAYISELIQQAIYREPSAKPLIMHATYQVLVYSGYMVMDGSGYCCDYVVYQPNQDHSLTCVHVLPSSVISVHSLVQYVRRAQSVKKVTCLAFCSPKRQDCAQAAIATDHASAPPPSFSIALHMRTNVPIRSVRCTEASNTFEVSTDHGSFFLRLLFIEHISKRVHKTETTTDAVIRIDNGRTILRSSSRNDSTYYKSPDGIVSFGSQCATVLPMHYIDPTSIGEDVAYHTSVHEYYRVIREINRSTHTFPRCLHTITCAEPNSFYRWLEQRELARLTPKSHSDLLREVIVEDALETYDRGLGYIPQPNCLPSNLIEQFKGYILYKYLCSGSVWSYPSAIKMEWGITQGITQRDSDSNIILTSAAAGTLREIAKSMIVSEILSLGVPRMEIAGYVGTQNTLYVHCCAPSCNLLFSTYPTRLFNRQSSPQTLYKDLCPLSKHILTHFPTFPTWRPFCCIHCIGALLEASRGSVNQLAHPIDERDESDMISHTKSILGGTIQEDMDTNQNITDDQDRTINIGEENSSPSSSAEPTETRRKRGPKSLVYRGDSSKNEASMPMISEASVYLESLTNALRTKGGQLVNVDFVKFYFSTIAEYTLHLQLHGIITHKGHFSRLGEEELLTTWRSGMSLSQHYIPYLCPTCHFSSTDYDSVLEHLLLHPICSALSKSPEAILSQLAIKNYKTHKKSYLFRVVQRRTPTPNQKTLTKYTEENNFYFNLASYSYYDCLLQTPS
ncbi:Hypothetical protein GLP15_1622 [Giardia lamblia P15]|uniref:tRNA-intron lyase n=1 Tax=Giardia intestinalis (strain P15) TaxID=658858 RepID=E1F7Z2_GIAIA|nr:Hypothetical protein GLP15_1622 [Giardia lamblia P15]